jgi:hypothetical protein
MKNINVRNFTHNGREVPNQFIITTDEGQYFQSYKSVIAFIPCGVWQKNDENAGKIILDTYYWDYSKTTGKYRNLFLNETKKETERKIQNGYYAMANLN